MKKPPVEVRESAIHGKGIFAVRDIAKGEVIWEWDLSYLILQEELSTLPSEELHFVCRYDDKHFVVNQPPYRYVNHSCEPNVEVHNFCDVALRDIRKDEEITGDYRGDSDGSAVEFTCSCGAPTCRGSVGKDI